MIGFFFHWFQMNSVNQDWLKFIHLFYLYEKNRTHPHPQILTSFIMQKKWKRKERIFWSCLFAYMTIINLLDLMIYYRIFFVVWIFIFFFIHPIYPDDDSNFFLFDPFFCCWLVANGHLIVCFIHKHFIYFFYEKKNKKNSVDSLFMLNFFSLLISMACLLQMMMMIINHSIFRCLRVALFFFNDKKKLWTGNFFSGRSNFHI